MDENEVIKFLKKVEIRAVFTTRSTTDAQRQAIRDCLALGYISEIKRNFYEITDKGVSYLSMSSKKRFKYRLGLTYTNILSKIEVHPLIRIMILISALITILAFIKGC